MENKTSKTGWPLWGFLVGLGLLLLGDFWVPKHPEFRWEGLPLFFPVFGLLGGLVFIAAAALTGRLLGREAGDDD